MKGRWRKSEGEMSVHSGPLTSRARGKFHVSATEHLQHPVPIIGMIGPVLVAMWDYVIISRSRLYLGVGRGSPTKIMGTTCFQKECEGVCRCTPNDGIINLIFALHFKREVLSGSTVDLL